MLKLCAIWLAVAAGSPAATSGFGTLYDAYGVGGAFVLYDRNRDQWLVYNDSVAVREFLPASTFKICNALIALQTGVAPGPSFMLEWDGTDRGVAAWNRSQDMRTAMRHSTVWYYQEIARRIGERRMARWVGRLGYGNADISGGIDRFWLTGGLRISPRGQVDFLRRLYEGRLPVSRRVMECVREMMVVSRSPGCVVRAKTGWAVDDGTGWYVGWVETAGNVYFFANCIRSSDPGPDFAKARTEIASCILHSLGIIPGQMP